MNEGQITAVIILILVFVVAALLFLRFPNKNAWTRTPREPSHRLKTHIPKQRRVPVEDEQSPEKQAEDLPVPHTGNPVTVTDAPKETEQKTTGIPSSAPSDKEKDAEKERRTAEIPPPAAKAAAAPVRPQTPKAAFPENVNVSLWKSDFPPDFFRNHHVHFADKMGWYVANISYTVRMSQNGGALLDVTARYERDIQPGGLREMDYMNSMGDYEYDSVTIPLAENEIPQKVRDAIERQFPGRNMKTVSGEKPKTTGSSTGADSKTGSPHERPGGDVQPGGLKQESYWQSQYGKVKEDPEDVQPGGLKMG